MRVGFGYDIHKLVIGRKLILGGVEIPFAKGLLGHSDADVLTHAICDALLGSIVNGDIGVNFPDDDPKYRGISSINLLKRVEAIIAKEGKKIGNIDSVIVAQEPKLINHISEMRKNIAEALKIDLGQVSIKATTTEGLGEIGKGGGMAAYATVLVIS